MQRLQVGLAERSYPITIGPGVLSTIGDRLLTEYRATRYCIVADDTVADLYGEELLQELKNKGLCCDLVRFPHGEENKNLATIAQLVSTAAQLGLDRKSMFLALGGGVTGDVAGFLAASYLRGVPFIQIPTTLLAQVDSSVGGKTGVDIPEGKNLVGAFYQPKAVFIDIDVLKTLPEEQYLSGLAEVIKTGFIQDDDFVQFLTKQKEPVLALDPGAVSEMIHTCCRIKADIVSRDEKESDLRRILNFGHTIGHAVEATSQFSIFHGWAVAIGMGAAIRIAKRRGLISESRAVSMCGLISSYGLPTEVPENLDRQKIKSYLLTDKKMVGGNLFFILPKEEGGVVITDEVSEEDINAVININAE